MVKKAESVASISAKQTTGDSAKTTRRVAESAHAVIDETADKAGAVEERLREQAARAGEKVESSQQAATDQLKRSLTQAESFAKERPIAAAGIAFAAGIVATTLLRR